MNYADSYSDIFTLPALHSTWARTEESDGCAGIDGFTLSRFNDYLDNELNRLSEELIALYRVCEACARESVSVRGRGFARDPDFYQV